MKTKLSQVRPKLPQWLLALYTLVAAGLVPWIVILGYTLPERHLSRHWDIAWVGFDIGMLVAVILTAVLALRRSGWVALSAMSVCTFLLIDAWFDILTSRPGPQTIQAVSMAVFVEIPLAIISFGLAYKVARELVKAR